MIFLLHFRCPDAKQRRGIEGRNKNMCSLVGGAAGGTDCGGAKLDREHGVAGDGAGHVARVLARAAGLSIDTCSVRGDTRNVRAEQLAQLRARGGQHELVARHAAGVRADEDDVRVARILQQPGSAGHGATDTRWTHVVQFMEIIRKLRSSHSLLGKGRFWWTKRFL